MVALLDANVILNYITDRTDPYSSSCKKIMEMCSSGILDGRIAFHSVSIIWYSLKLPDSEKREWLADICDVLKVSSASHDQILEAISNTDFKDFEDCLQDECAIAADADVLITCNTKDYLNAKTRVCDPDEFVSVIGI